jgi:hypothetical protein
VPDIKPNKSKQDRKNLDDTRPYELTEWHCYLSYINLHTLISWQKYLCFAAEFR